MADNTLSTEYGNVFTLSDTESNLYENDKDVTGSRTWYELYGGANSAYEGALASYKQDYADAIAEAYASSLKNKGAIYQSDLVGGGRQAQLDYLDQAMQSAYETYRSNLYEQEESLYENYTSTISNINSALETQATNYNSLYSSAYDYLEYLYNAYEEASDEDNIFLNNPLWSKYTVTEEETDSEGNVVTDSEGNPVTTTRLKTWDELSAVGAKDAVTGEYTGLFDESGNLTVAGADFYDQMFNAINSIDKNGTYKYGATYGSWLHDTNEDLFNWATSANAYNYTEAGTNIGSVKETLGMVSTDETYQFIERFGGLSQTQVEELYSGFQDSIDELINAANASSAKGDAGGQIVKSIQELTTQLKDYCEILGIDEASQIDWTTLSSNLANYYSNTKTSAEMTGDWFKTWAIDTGTFAASGAAVGAGAGYVAGTAAGTVALPVLGTASGGAAGAVAGGAFGAVVGAVAGMIAGIVDASIQVSNQRKTNQQMAQTATQLLNNTLVTLTQYSKTAASDARLQAQKKYNLK